MKLSFFQTKYRSTDCKNSVLFHRGTTHAGFTLLEMLFAVVIFSFALVSLMLIAGKGVIATASAKDQLTAQYLAEEGAEVVRNVRDGNFVNQNDWLMGIDCTKENPCDVSYNNGSSLESIGSQGRFLSASDTGYFSGDETISGEQKFSRAIYLEDAGAGDQKIIVVKITWKQRSVDREFEFRTYISNWQEPSIDSSL